MSHLGEDGKEDPTTPENLGEGTEGTRKSLRNPTLTDKGKQYQDQNLSSYINTTVKRLEKQIIIINQLLAGSSAELVNNEMVMFDKTYGDLTDAYARICQLFSGEEAEDKEKSNKFAVLMEQTDDTYLDCKSRVCQWLIEREKEDALLRVERGSRHSSKSSRSSKRSFKSASSGKSDRSLHEEAKIAGFKAEIEALKKTKEAELTAEMSRLESKIKKAEAKKEVYAAHELFETKEVAEIVPKSEGLGLKSERPLPATATTSAQISSNPTTKELTANTSALITNSTNNTTNDTHNTNKTSHLHQAMMEMIKLQSAPKPDLEVFSGNPLEYLYFLANFREVVESAVTDQRGRLTRLIKYTSGDAQELIKHLVHAETSNCYDKAIALLNKEYGNPHLLSCSYLRELRQWKNIAENEADGFKKLYRFLLRCQTYKEGGRLQELDSTDMIATVVSKLHSGHQGRWNRKAVDIRRSGGEAKFSDLVAFFEKETEILNDPAYSKKALAQVKTITSRATHVTRSECAICNKHSHDIEDCEEYLKLDIDQRHKTIFRLNLCFCCLHPIGDDHIAKTCTKKRKCRTCGESHPTTLHGGNSASSFHTTVPHQSAVSMCVVPVQLWHQSRPEHKLEVYALIDDCCTGTFVSDEVLEFLDVPATETSVIVRTLTGKTVEPTTSVTGLRVKCTDSHAKSYPSTDINLPTTFSRPSLEIEKEEIPTPSKIEQWEHLRVLREKIPEYDPTIPLGLMIGGNCPQACVPQEAIEGREGPFAKRSRLGWCVVGPTANSDAESAINCYHTKIIPVTDVTTGQVSNHHFAVQEEVSDESITGFLKEMYANEFNEKDGEKMALSHEDEVFLEIMKNGAKKKEGKIELPLPFRDKNLLLPNNRQQALNRAISLKRRLTKNEPLKVAYCEIMRDLVKKYAQKADKSKDQPGKVWHVMHHAVKNKVKNKWRVVFNLTARCKGRCLNEELIQGPDLTNLLVGVLVRFRKESVAFMADIEAMFYQVKVPEEQRSYLRFFWWEDENFDAEPSEWEMCVHLFGAISSGGCANYALKKTADDNENRFGPDAAKTIKRDFYVDDWLKSVRDILTAQNLIRNVQSMCEAGGFNLTKFISNSREVITSIPPDKRAPSVVNLDLSSSLPIERALGVQWCVEKDSLSFRITMKDTPLTRRGILGTISSIYDPLGLASPFLLKGRKILQRITMENNQWDDDLSPQMRADWEEWHTELLELSKLEVERCYKPPNFDVVSYSLHSFSDASDYGYGTATYLRQVDSGGQVSVSLVMGKSRVVPADAPTVPRTELAAAVLSAEVSAMLKEELDMEGLTVDAYWIDSMVVLGYIQNDQKRYRRYVANRTKKFRKVAGGKDRVRYVKSKLNPADDASRGLSMRDTDKVNRWFHGPAFLKSNAEDFPEIVMAEVDPNDPELLKEVTTKATVLNPEKTRYPDILSRLSLVTSNWMFMKRVVATVLCFVECCRRKRKCPIILVKDVATAENTIAKLIQRKHFEDEVTTLQRERNVRNSSSIVKLNPFLDKDGVMRVGGRLKKSALPTELKHPIILPKKEIIVQRLIEWYHIQIQHLGRTTTLNEIRDRGYWIINGNSQVRRVVDKCVPCKVFRGPLLHQKMSDLPENRTLTAPPFTYCGVDLFGPFLIKERRSELKRYGVVFTCFSCRGVHLETVTSLETDTFILALRRFLGRRGPVRYIRSDNGTDFVGADNEMKKLIEEMDHNKIKRFLEEKNCDWDWMSWERNPPSASHMGGVWERQIRSVRNVLASLLNEHAARLNDESLRTLLVEVEAIINSRPLTADMLSDQSIMPLSPSNLLTLKTKVVLPPPGIFQREDVYCRKRWRAVQFLANEFWSRWKKEYLMNLQQRQKWTSSPPNIQVDDVVLVADLDAKRCQWPMGRIVEVHPSDDGIVRKVSVKVNSSDTPLLRPITKLVLIMKKPSTE